MPKLVSLAVIRPLAAIFFATQHNRAKEKRTE
jgi:hypothetical protein